jgi:hypothetical protein
MSGLGAARPPNGIAALDEHELPLAGLATDHRHPATGQT